MFLTEDELTELTGKRQNAARVRVLNGLGIQHKIRADGSVVVLRAHVERVLGETVERQKEEWRPTWMAS